MLTVFKGLIKGPFQEKMISSSSEKQLTLPANYAYKLPTQVIKWMRSKKLITINIEPGTEIRLKSNSVFSRLLSIKPKSK